MKRKPKFKVGQKVPGYGTVVSSAINIMDPLIEFTLNGHRVYAHEIDVLYVLRTERETKKKTR